jgi:putative SOS response-associated peptidase YedK
MAPIHDRMPVVLPVAGWDRWLDRDSDPVALADLLVPADPGLLDRYRVSRLVNHVTNNGPGLVEPDPSPDTVGPS